MLKLAVPANKDWLQLYNLYNIYEIFSRIKFAYVLSQALNYLCNKFHLDRFSSYDVKARQTEIHSHL